MLPYPNLRMIGIGPIKIYMWGVMVALGFFTALFLAAREAKKRKLNPDIVYSAGIYAMAGALVGGRLAYTIAHYPEFVRNPIEVFKIWHGGMIFYGGFILSILLVYIYIKKNKIDFWKYGDLLAPYIGLGVFIGRIGCFLNGCCFGKPTSLPWAFIFPHAPDILPRHPTQLYHSLSGLAIFFIAKNIKKIKPLKKIKGAKLMAAVMSYSLLRFVIEFFRYYRTEYYFLGLTGSQFVSIFLFAVSGYYFYTKIKKNL